LDIAGAAAQFQNSSVEIRKCRQRPLSPQPARDKPGNRIIGPGKLAVEAVESPLDKGAIEERCSKSKTVVL
jgi:hypothetical protein